MAKILLIEPNLTSRKAIKEILSEHTVDVVHGASLAVQKAADEKPDLIILEMSLGGHSGLEFLYEFRTYSDWALIPVIVYSSIKLTDEVLSSRAWSKLNIYDYLYKPSASLASLKNAAEKALKQS